MITIIKLGKNIKIQSYNKGLKFFLVYRKKWIMIKLTKYQVRLLLFILKIFVGKE